MYDITGWMNNPGSGDLNYYNLYNNPADGGYEEELNYVPSGGTYQQGGYTTSWGGNEATPVTSGWTPTQYSSTPTTSQSLGSTSTRTAGGGSSGVQVIPSTLYGTRSTTQYIGGGALPTMTAPTFNLPTYDYGRINYLAQQQAAPLYSKARNALTTGIGKIASTDNPYMQSQARKQLMSGYGTGISEIAASAARTGAQLYAPEYQGQMTKATTEYGGQLSTAQANFQAALADWQKSFKTVTTEERDYGQGYGSSNGTSKGYWYQGKFTPYTSPGYNDERDISHWNAWKAMIPSGARIA